jgi:replicative DNA helicase Mcm
MTEELALEARIIKFLKEFRDEYNKTKYLDIVNALPAIEDKILVINFNDLLVFDKDLAKELADNPIQFIDATRTAILELLKIERPLDAPYIAKEDIYVAISGDEPGYFVKLRDISSKYIGRLITINGLLVKVSQVFSIPKKAVFRCETCGREYPVELKSVMTRISKPKCRHNKRVYNCVLDKEKTLFTDVQYARIQERPDELPPGQIPRFIDIIFEKPMIDKAYPGDIVKIVGILDIKERQRRDRAEYDFILIGNFIESREKEAFEVIITKQEEEEIKRRAKEPGFYQKLIDSFAPSIYGYREVKEALLLSLIGGEDRVLMDGTKVRGNIHILLVGDPGLAKSQLLKYAAYIAPKGIYTSGRGSTAAGLTAAVIKEAGGGMSLEAGAVVLADMGVCAIDEIDKMRNEDRVALHEAMEQMTVSISKGGIIATLNARTTIIAAANPVDGVYNPYKPLVRNVNLPVTLLSRFDLIHIIRDELSEERDRVLTDHMIMTRISEKPFEDKFDVEFMRKFVAYARKMRVTMSDEASRILQDYFIKMRRAASVSEEITTVPITPRQFEALIRLAEASAKAHLRNLVTDEDARIAISQMNLYLQKAALDIESQQPDITQIMVGTPAKRASKTNTILSILREMITKAGGQPVSEQDLINEIVKKTNIKDRDEIMSVIDKMKRDGIIYEPMPGFYNLVYYRGE